jgi:hypothetical protein
LPTNAIWIWWNQSSPEKNWVPSQDGFDSFGFPTMFGALYAIVKLLGGALDTATETGEIVLQLATREM